jgi:hypothetical protein
MVCGHCGCNHIYEMIREDPYIAKQICRCGVKILVENKKGELHSHLVSRGIPDEYKDKISKMNLPFNLEGLTPCPLKLEEDIWTNNFSNAENDRIEDDENPDVMD